MTLVLPLPVASCRPIFAHGARCSAILPCQRRIRFGAAEPCYLVQPDRRFDGPLLMSVPLEIVVALPFVTQKVRIAEPPGKQAARQVGSALIAARYPRIDLLLHRFNDLRLNAQSRRKRCLPRAGNKPSIHTYFTS